MSQPQRHGAANRLRLAVQHLLPHHLLTRLARAAAHWQWLPWAHGLIRWFVRAYHVDLGSRQ